MSMNDEAKREQRLSGNRRKGLGSTEQGQKKEWEAERIKHEVPKGSNEEWNEGVPFALTVRVSSSTYY
jgi:hypothetical protein